ncbi:MAG: hypothetical protein HYY18_02365 [Planctomycetes bacterium]|nr:hypothetical protein [Planctomycetota bacterium]
MTHPSRETLALLAYGFLDEGEAAAAGAHVGGCAACRAEREARQREREAVKAAFEPAAQVSWRPFWMGAAAAALLAVSVWGLTRPAEERASAGTARSPDSWMWAREGSGTRVLEDGAVEQIDGRVFYDDEWAPRDRRVRAAHVTFESAGSGGIRMEVLMRPEVKGATAGIVAVAVAAGIVLMKSEGAEVRLGPGDSAAVEAGSPPVVLRAGEDGSAERRALEARLEELRKGIAARRAAPAPATVLPTPRDFARGLAKALRDFGTPDRKMALQNSLGNYRSALAAEMGVTPNEVGFSPAIDRLFAGLLEAAGLPLEEEAQAALERMLAEQDGFWNDYRARRGEWTELERFAAGVRPSVRWEQELAALLNEDQKKFLSAEVFRFQGRTTEFIWHNTFRTYEPGEVAAQVDNLPRRTSWPGKIDGATFEKIRPALVEYYEAATKAYLERKELEPGKEREELELRAIDEAAAAQRRLMDRFGLTEEETDYFFTQFVCCAPEKK